METSDGKGCQEVTNELGGKHSDEPVKRSLRERSCKRQVKSLKNSKVNDMSMSAKNSTITDTCAIINSKCANDTNLYDTCLHPFKPHVQSSSGNSNLVHSDTSKCREDANMSSSKNNAASIISSDCISEHSNTLQNSQEICVSKPKKRVTDEIGPDGVWKVRTYTGYIVTLHVNLDLGRPQEFSSDNTEVMWHTANEINMMRLKHQIQRGEYIPNDAIIDLDPSPLKIPQEESENLVLESEEKRTEKLETWENLKLSVLQKEVKIVESVITLQECFSQCEPQWEKGLEVLDNFPYLELTALTLKKYPFVVYTLQNLCNYEQQIINQSDSTKKIIEKVREKAKELYSKIQTIFDNASNVEFEQKFKEQYFLLWKIYGFSTKRIQEIVKDPTLQFL